MMKLCLVFIVIALYPAYVLTQSESDSLFFFDYRMNSCSKEDAKRISRKSKFSEYQYQVRTTRADTSYRIKFETIDIYSFISDDSLVIERSFSKWGNRVPGVYRIDVDIIEKRADTFKIDLYSKELNIHKTVLSKTLVPICPIGKTTFYHPNCTVSKVYDHESAKSQLWNSHGEEIEPFLFRDEVDSMPIISKNNSTSFDLDLKRFIQKTIKYSAIARENDVTGRIFVVFIVTKTGEIEQLEIMLDGIHPLINNAALDVFNQLKFERPAIKDGQPVDLKLRHSISFNVQ